ncbi:MULTISPECIES: hypothetical protein [Streptomyces]|uniref:Uncharacterized protein n=1 Tax=Streptomyces griseofuscus TaxID=146922 RepID=A0A7H1PT94_9ACTN|nr:MULTISPECIES: hypothetical protein [Streptomyces]MBA9049614.1 hypothetical protein [Streptomyces murinus]QNT91274.1 hypothetical protein HEP81_00940 [Streptomyces griseofuscus]BBC92151.1 hypothetical protein SRO_0975 [Streptomyces rochei]
MRKILGANLELPSARKHRAVGTPDFLPRSYSDAVDVADRIESVLRGRQAG